MGPQNEQQLVPHVVLEGGSSVIQTWWIKRRPSPLESHLSDVAVVNPNQDHVTVGVIVQPQDVGH